MKKHIKSLISFFFVYILVCVISISGCSGGGGGGTVLPPTNETPVHTTFNQSVAYVGQTGQSTNCSVTVSETRGDEISISRMTTYRTFSNDSGKTSNFYSSSPGKVYGWMFDVPSTMSNNIRDAVITDSSNASVWNGRKLQPYERRTLSVQVMIGKPSQTKPSTFTGLFIPYAECYTWKNQGQNGVKYWVTFEGYDNKQNEPYNFHMPLEVRFPDLTTDPYNTGTGTGTGTNPYDAI